MDCDSPCAEVINAQYTADDIPSHAIKDENLPDGVAIFIQDRGGMRDQAAVPRRVMSTVFRGMGVMVKV